MLSCQMMHSAPQSRTHSHIPQAQSRSLVHHLIFTNPFTSKEAFGSFSCQGFLLLSPVPQKGSVQAAPDGGDLWWEEMPATKRTTNLELGQGAFMRAHVAPEQSWEFYRPVKSLAARHFFEGAVLRVCSLLCSGQPVFAFTFYTFSLTSCVSKHETLPKVSRAVY